MSLRVLAAAIAAATAAASPESCPGRDADAASLLQATGGEAWRRAGLADPEEDSKAMEVGCASNFTPVEGGSEVAGDVFGRVSVKAFRGPNLPNSGTQLSFDLLDVDPACQGGPGSASGSCGVRIHTGTCAALGPHLYSSTHREMDPWPCVSYASVEYRTELGSTTTTAEPVLAERAAVLSKTRYVTFKTKGVVSVYTGEPPEDIKGAVVAIYDHAGKVMACSPISTEKDHRLPASAATTFRPLKAEHWVKQSSAVSGMVWGQVLIFERMGKTAATTGQLLSWDLEEVDRDCAKGPSADPKSCAVRVEVGSCSTPVTQGDLYDEAAVTKNPWDCVSYTSLVAERIVKARGHGLPAYTGVGSPMALGQVIKVYDYHGVPMACAEITLFEE